MLGRTERLTKQILADRAVHLKREEERTNKRDRLPGADFDPFDEIKWKTVAGPDPGYLPSTPVRMGKVGFHVACKACGQQFESKGLVYCLACMEIPAEERRAMKPAVTGRLCQAPGCENFIPRRARADVMYCSSACRVRAHRERKNVTLRHESVSD